jgi:Ca2+:H+ antiporter
MSQIARLAFAWITVVLFLLFGGTWLADPISTLAAAALFLWLFATMVWSAFGAIKVADTLALILGEPLGSLVLTLTIICLEGVLIGIAIMTSDSGRRSGATRYLALT